MKRPFIVRIVIVTFMFCVLVGLIVSVRPVMLATARDRIEGLFPGSVTQIGGLRIAPRRYLLFSDIYITKTSFYTIEVKEIRIEYNLFSLLKKRISGIILGDTVIRVQAANRPSQELLAQFPFVGPAEGVRQSAASSGGVSIQAVVCSRVSVLLKTKDLTCSGEVSCELRPETTGLRSLQATITSLKNAPFTYTDIYLEVNPGEEVNRFSVRQIGYQKATIDTVAGSFAFSEGELTADITRGVLFGGNLSGRAVIALTGEKAFTLRGFFTDLNLENAVRELELEKRLWMDGLVSGVLVAEGRIPAVEDVKGHCTVQAPGGVLDVTDEQFLERIARGTGQSVDLVRAAFTDYSFTAGAMDVSLEKDALVATIGLDGEKGKRDVQLTFHNIFKKEGL
ncbi:MAG: hypothetical protein JW844_03205 [Candidatus Omnitrophica bacterium]|nr:hypothetical protein [Candidatus Omnitrophota bacterium]